MCVLYVFCTYLLTYLMCGFGRRGITNKNVNSSKSEGSNVVKITWALEQDSCPLNLGSDPHWLLTMVETWNYLWPSRMVLKRMPYT